MNPFILQQQIMQMQQQQNNMRQNMHINDDNNKGQILRQSPFNDFDFKGNNMNMNNKVTGVKYFSFGLYKA